MTPPGHTQIPARLAEILSLRHKFVILQQIKIAMDINTSELLFYTGEDGMLRLLSMCVTVEPSKPLRHSELKDIKFQFQLQNKNYTCARCSEPPLGISAYREAICHKGTRNEEEKTVNGFKQQAKALMGMGFTDEQIMEIIKDCRQKNQILVDNRLNVFLVDGGTMVEIEMNPLSKTIFLFYLKHPEGVALKCLSDYKAELSHIYSRLTGRDSIEDIEKSIRDLVDPTSNSVHEKCSRIKAAFKDKVSSSAVTDYVPSGKQGEPRFISIDRNLVTWEGSL